MIHCRGVVPGGVGGVMALPDFGRSLNPISTSRGRLCPPSNSTPGFSDLPTALHCYAVCKLYVLVLKVFLEEYGCKIVCLNFLKSIKLIACISDNHQYMSENSY